MDDNNYNSSKFPEDPPFLNELDSIRNQPVDSRVLELRKHREAVEIQNRFIMQDYEKKAKAAEIRYKRAVRESLRQQQIKRDNVKKKVYSTILGGVLVISFLLGCLSLGELNARNADVVNTDGIENIDDYLKAAEKDAEEKIKNDQLAQFNNYIDSISAIRIGVFDSYMSGGIDSANRYLSEKGFNGDFYLYLNNCGYDNPESFFNEFKIRENNFSNEELEKLRLQAAETFVEPIPIEKQTVSKGM